MKIRVAGILLIFLAIFFYDKEIAMAQLQEIRLPEPIKVGKVSVEEAILKRRSQRNFVSQDLDWPQISQLLWATQGITARKGGLAFRSAPSAGALYPMEVYLLSKDGLFHYLPNGHRLEVVGQDDLRSSLAQAALDQTSVAQASVNIVICAVYQRVTGKYGERGIRFVHIEAGHVAQNIHLQAVAMGLGSVPIGAFIDEEVKEVLSLPDDQEPIYIIPVGYTK
ncbi:MAG: SagB/ThcOx family dehydrogenase [Candidatus Omnitrophota bacterium]|jgi:SagB-type dehydrogenase family enzyme